MTETMPKVVKINPVQNNQYLKARVDVAFPSGLIIHAVSVFRRQNGDLSIVEPNAAMLGKDGKALTDDRGKVRYWPTISFADKAAQERWRRSVLDAIRAMGPDAIDR
jgi:hypothetical protein